MGKTFLILSLSLYQVFYGGPVLAAEHPNNSSVIKDEITVKFKSGFGRNNRQAAISPFSKKSKHFEDTNKKRGRKKGPAFFDDLVNFKLKPGFDQDEVIKILKRNPHVEYAVPNIKFESFATVPNDTQFSSQWGFNNTGQSGGTADADIDAAEAWDIEKGDASIVVAVLDSGIQYTHDDLASNMWVNEGEIPGNGLDDDNNGYVDDIHGYDFYDADSDPSDGHSHGTHCAGIIAAAGDNNIGVVGVTWSAKVMALKFMSDDAGGSGSAALAAIQYAINNGAHITSNSWGSTSQYPALDDAFQAAEEAGVFSVAAMGNHGTSAPLYPAAYDPLFAVGATTDQDTRAGFSAYGPHIEVVAPGMYILSTWNNNGTGTKSGTSMATPFVAGLAALILSRNPDLTVNELKNIIRNSADDLGEPGKDDFYGHGRINAYQALVLTPGDPLPSNNPPLANNQSVSTNEDTPKAITLTGSDIDGDTLSYLIVSSPSNGSLTGTGANRTYTPSLNYSGGDSFTFKVNDGTVDSSIATVAITVNDGSNPGTLSLTQTSVSVGEGAGSVTLSVQRTGGTNGAASIQYETQNGLATSGSDFTAATGTLNFSDGDAGPKTIAIPLADDVVEEGNETFSLVLKNASGAALGGAASATIQINENDLTSVAVDNTSLTIDLADAAALAARLSPRGREGITLQTRWIMTSGPGNMAANDSTSLVTTARFDRAGTYTVKIEALVYFQSSLWRTIGDTMTISVRGATPPTPGASNKGFFNPNREKLAIDYVLASDAAVTVRLFDRRGDLIKEINEGYKPAGSYAAEWDGRSLSNDVVASGIYLVLIEGDNGLRIKKKVAVLK